MNLAHVHLLLNHFPTVGTVIAFGLLLLALIRKNEGMRRAGLEIFCVIALLTLPAYLAGVATQAIITELPGISVPMMARHHDAALIASVGMLLTGFTAWLGLWQIRRTSQQSFANLAAVLIFSALTMVLMGRAATMGGEIRHPEILAAQAAEDELEALDPAGEPPIEEAPPAEASEPEPEPEPASDAEAPPEKPAWYSAAGVATIVSENVWLWPSMEALHFTGMWVLFGTILLVHLRMLGFMKSVSFDALHRLLPWAVLSLTVNVITGMAFVIGAPEMYSTNVSFFWKIGLLMLAGFNLLYFTVFEGPWEVKSGDDAPLRVKAAAASAIALWFGVMYFGRMMPFLGNSF
jgi:uncharacterized membrane protein